MVNPAEAGRVKANMKLESKRKKMSVTEVAVPELGHQVPLGPGLVSADLEN